MLSSFVGTLAYRVFLTKALRTPAFAKPTARQAVLVVVLATSPRRLKLREATSGRLSSNPATRNDGVLECGSIAGSRNYTPRPRGWRC